MPVIRPAYVTRFDLRAAPDTLFVFGDNLDRKGLGGQAAAMRGEPNAVGIPTKRSPHMASSAFFTDADLDRFLSASRADFARITDHLKAGKTVAWPAAHIGTGLADLPARAPAIFRVIDDFLTNILASPEGGA